MNNTPIYNALKHRQHAIRFHMPGHMGEDVFGFNPFSFDFTETYGTGNLYVGDAPFDESFKLCAKYFGTKDAIMSTNGSSGSLMACISLMCPLEITHIIVDRNCHKSVLHALVLLDKTPVFVYPEIVMPFGFPSEIPITEFERAISITKDGTPVLLTSPNYYGFMQNIKNISTLLKKHNRPLLVDEAHGAHLTALGLENAVMQGADVAVTSAHKTLPALTQGSFVLSDGYKKEHILQSLSLFNTSSPSYPIMTSLELACSYMMNGGSEKYLKISDEVKTLRHDINEHTDFYACTGHSFDPLRLTIFMADSHFTGHELSCILFEKYNIAIEMADNRNIVLIITGQNTKQELQALFLSLKELSKQAKPKEISPYLCDEKIPKLQIDVSVREAFFSKHEEIPLLNSVGKICAKPITPYPPGVPLIYPGEKITYSVIEFMQKLCYNSEYIQKICVLID